MPAPMINILLVEDNPINQLVAVKMLRRWGMEAAVANNGQEALTMIGSQSFQLILMDLDMPVMDGYDSTLSIRNMNDAYFKTIPIIAFSASDISDARQKALRSGMTDFVQKPLQQDELQNTIDKYVLPTMKNERGLRPLLIDFDQYTDGDADFKLELISLMVVDIGELQKSLVQATRLNDPELFKKGCHKSKTTVAMVDDKELILLLEDLEIQMAEGKTKGCSVFGEKMVRFNKIAEDLLKSLSHLGQQ